MSTLFKRTKIVATIGPSVNSKEQIDQLIQSGVNACRLNHSHGDFPERDQQIAWIREAQVKKGRSVAIIQDLQGPKIRLGELQNNSFTVQPGDELILDHAITHHDGSNILPVQYNLAEKVQVNEPLSMFDGKVSATITDIVSHTAIKIKIQNHGQLMSKKGINLPDTDFGSDIITEKDLEDIAEGAKRDFDYVAMSFVQTAEDIEKLRQILLSHNSSARIIAKIETKKAISTDQNLENIVKATDGIMVARGDMAVEAGVEVVPIVQKKLVQLCRKHSKFCIIATQMLNSMTENPEPTRAEANDIADAVMQGADAVMLSDETANGKYPLEAVATMKKIILYTQNHSPIDPISTEPTSNYQVYDAISSSAARLAEQLKTDIILCQTSSGATAETIAAARPNLPIIAVTDNQRVANQLAITYATSAFFRPYSHQYGIELVKELKSNGYLKTTDQAPLSLILTSGNHNSAGATDTIKYRQI